MGIGCGYRRATMPPLRAAIVRCLALTILLGSVAESLDRCLTKCDGQESVIYDPDNCGQFYVCFPHGADGPYTCPEDTPYFNGTDCDAHYACCTDPCEPRCVVAGSEIPDPYDCSRYYVCVTPGPVQEDLHFQCPPGQNFDPAGFCHESSPCSVLCMTSTHLPFTTDPTTYQPDTTTYNPPDTTTYIPPDTTTYNPPDTTTYNPPVTTTYYPTDSTTYSLPDSTTYNPPETTIYNPPDTTTYSPPDTTTYNPPESTTYNPPESTTYIPPETTTYNPPESTTYNPPDTTTYNPPETTPHASTPLPDCTNNLLCEEEGLFPKCNYCHPEYYYCQGPDYYADLRECEPGLLFNPNHDFPMCIKEESCPFP